MIYNHGVDKVDEIVQLALFANLIKQRGAWFHYEDPMTGEPAVFENEVCKWQGRNAVVEFVRHHPDFMTELENKLRGIQVDAPTGEAVKDQDGYELGDE